MNYGLLGRVVAGVAGIGCGVAATSLAIKGDYLPAILGGGATVFYAGLALGKRETDGYLEQLDQEQAGWEAGMRESQREMDRLFQDTQAQLRTTIARSYGLTDRLTS